MPIPWFNGLLIAWVALALGSFAALLWRPAPYGRYFETGWGRPIGPRAAWILMETPAVLVLPLWFAFSERTADPASRAFAAIWLLHYVHRAWIYPFRKPAGRPMPLFLVACAFAFNAINGSFNGGWLFFFAPAYPEHYLSSAPFLVGLALFLAGLAINVHADTVLIRLRKEDPQRYRVPRGGLYRFISCPNYFGEILEWFGWALLTWSLAGLSFAVWTAANLAPRALMHHRFYRERIEGYPAERKAILPFLC